MKNKPMLSTAGLSGFLLLTLTATVTMQSATAQDDSDGVEQDTQSIPYSEDGADTCLKCHDEDSEFPVLSIFKTRHARSSDKRTPFADLQCENCHGPGGEHSKRVRRGETRPPITNFGKNAATSAIDQNKICLNCHQDHGRTGWQGSVHEQNDVACASCHTVHAHRDPVLVADKQPQVCFDCHKKERADIYKASVHPVRYGKMACTDCHDAHASNSYASLIRPTLNETCYTCHAEKRGPFLWEHQPAAEDCSLCHKSHGSNHTPLLTKRAPLLCQDCHSRFGHPSVQYTADGLPGNRPSKYLLSGSCMNCHSQVHGSNHPSGADFSR